MEKIKADIMKAIQEGKITPHSKWYFLARTLGVVALLVLIVMVTLYIGSFTIFMLQASGLMLLVGSGAFGLGMFFQQIPWALICIIVGIIGMLLISQNTSFSYRKPTLYIFGLVVAVIVVGSFLVSVSGFHKKVYEIGRGDQHVRSFYEHFADPQRHRGTPGEIVEIRKDGIVVVTPMQEMFTVFISSTTRVLSKDALGMQDKVLIIGDRKDGIIQADVIEEITSQERDDLFMRRGNPVQNRQLQNVEGMMK